MSEEPNERQQPIATVPTEELTAALRQVIDKGLPTSEKSAGILLDLRSVYARAVIPSDRLSRLQALNELLPRLVSTLSDADWREATQMLFGLTPGTRGTSLMARRRQAADALGFSLSHFREEKEQDVLQAVAVAVYNDLLRYQSRVKRSDESLEPTGDTPRLGPEHLTHEEELVSRIWSRVYGLRAEVIAVARLSEAEGFESQVEDHRQATLREEASLQELLREYRDTYGEKLIRHGEAEFTRAALERLAGWRLSADEASTTHEHEPAGPER